MQCSKSSGVKAITERRKLLSISIDFSLPSINSFKLTIISDYDGKCSSNQPITAERTNTERLVKKNSSSIRHPGRQQTETHPCNIITSMFLRHKNRAEAQAALVTRQWSHKQNNTKQTSQVIKQEKALLPGEVKQHKSVRKTKLETTSRWAKPITEKTSLLTSSNTRSTRQWTSLITFWWPKSRMMQQSGTLAQVDARQHLKALTKTDAWQDKPVHGIWWALSYQSAYCKHHSTWTALLTKLDSVCTNCYNSSSTCLVALALSVAFIIRF